MPRRIKAYKPDLMELEELVRQGYINKQKHPEADLVIWNYSKKTQYDNVWNVHTKNCRGLITDLEGNVKARPFAKFWNYEQLDPKDIPKEPFLVFDKHDGSLGITYWLDGSPQIATRGSFTSEQAIKANEILQQKYPLYAGFMDSEYTYLFEIIYPANRIVVDYGNMEDLILLALIHTQTGEEIPVNPVLWPGKYTTPYHNITDIPSLKKMDPTNSEGFVVRFENGFRMKLKFEEYMRLHRILTGVSNKMIWEYLRDNKPLTQLLERVPDEFYDYVKRTEERLRAEYRNIEATCQDDLESLPEDLSRRDMAEIIKGFDYPNIVFSMLDKHDYSQAIWKLVRPKFAKAFAEDIDA